MGVIIIEIMKSSIATICFRIGFGKRKSRLWKKIHAHGDGLTAVGNGCTSWEELYSKLKFKFKLKWNLN